MTVGSNTVDSNQIQALAKDLKQWTTEKSIAPLLLRLAWHGSGTYDKNSTKAWPSCGGANASIRLKPEKDYLANTGLNIAIDGLEQFHEKYPTLSYADLYQLASAIGIEVCGGPHIPLRFGRLDCPSSDLVPEDGYLARPVGPFTDGSKDIGQHLRKVFYRMGLSDQDIVALSGAHTLGRVHKERSGATAYDKTKYTEHVKAGSTAGGQSWTADWLTFNNSYFKGLLKDQDEELLVLPSDQVLVEDPEFKKYTVKYAEDEKLFFEDYAKSQVKLSELGTKFVDDKPVLVDY